MLIGSGALAEIVNADAKADRAAAGGFDLIDGALDRQRALIMRRGADADRALATLVAELGRPERAAIGDGWERSPARDGEMMMHAARRLCIQLLRPKHPPCARRSSSSRRFCSCRRLAVLKVICTPSSSTIDSARRPAPESRLCCPAR